MKTLGQIFTKNHQALPNLLVKAQQLGRLDKLLRSFLEATLARHCHLASIEDGEMVVVADSSTWATRLRYAIPDILKSIKTQPEFKDLKKIRYSVSIEQSLPASKKKKDKLSSTNEKLWKETLAQLSEKRKAKISE